MGVLTAVCWWIECATFGQWQSNLPKVQIWIGGGRAYDCISRANITQPSAVFRLLAGHLCKAVHQSSGLLSLLILLSFCTHVVEVGNNVIVIQDYNTSQHRQGQSLTTASPIQGYIDRICHYKGNYWNNYSMARVSAWSLQHIHRPKFPHGFGTLACCFTGYNLKIIFG